MLNHNALYQDEEPEPRQHRRQEKALLILNRNNMRHLNHLLGKGVLLNHM